MPGRQKNLAAFDEQTEKRGREHGKAKLQSRPADYCTAQHKKTGAYRQEAENVPGNIGPGAVAMKGLTRERQQKNRSKRFEPGGNGEPCGLRLLASTDLHLADRKIVVEKGELPCVLGH